MKKEWIEKALERELLLVDLVNSLKAGKTHGLEYELRVFLREAILEDGIITRKEINNRSDLYIPSHKNNPPEWVEIKCYDNIHQHHIQRLFMKDFDKLCEKDGNSLKTFLYFGLYHNGNLTHAPKDIGVSEEQLEKERKILVNIFADFALGRHITNPEYSFCSRKFNSSAQDPRYIYARWLSFYNQAVIPSKT